MLKLREHQEEIIKFVLSPNKVGKNRFSTFIFADVGTGKTATTLELAHRYPDLEFLILVHKKDMIKSWEEEMMLFFGKILENVILKAYTTKIENIKHDILIVDEIHKLKGMKSQFLNIFRYLEFKKAIFLTATPIDSLEDVFFYFLLTKSSFFGELRTAQYDLKKGRKIISEWRKRFNKNFTPKTQNFEIFDISGKSFVQKRTVKFQKNEKYLKEIIKENAIFVKNYEVIEDVQKFSIENFIPIEIKLKGVDNFVKKITEKEQKLREEFNAHNFVYLLEYIEKNETFKKFQKDLQVQKDARNVDNVLILQEEIKILKERIDFLKTKVYSSITPSNKWINEKVEKHYQISEKKLKHIEKNSILVYFFKENQKFLEWKLDNWTNSPQKFMTGKYDHLITHASTIAEGINGLQKQTNKVLFWDIQQSRLRVEQLIGRINRIGLIKQAEFKYFQSTKMERDAWKQTKEKITLEEWLNQ